MDAAAAAAAAVVHQGYLTCIVVSSLVGRPFIKANRRCVCSSSSIRIQLPYLPPLLPLPLPLLLPFSHQFWGIVFLFFSLFCHPYHSIVFPLSFEDDHNILPTRPFSAFLSVFLFLFLCRVVIPDDVFHQDLSQKASKQTAIRNHCLLARFLARLVRFSFFLTR